MAKRKTKSKAPPIAIIVDNGPKIVPHKPAKNDGKVWVLIKQSDLNTTDPICINIGGHKYYISGDKKTKIPEFVASALKDSNIPFEIVKEV